MMQLSKCEMAGPNLRKKESQKKKFLDNKTGNKIFGQKVPIF